MNEKEVFDRVIAVLEENNLEQGKDYVFAKAHQGCFKITLCPRRFATLDIHYIYERIPDIKVFKIKQKKNIMQIILKIKIRR